MSLWAAVSGPTLRVTTAALVPNGSIGKDPRVPGRPGKGSRSKATLHRGKLYYTAKGKRLRALCTSVSSKVLVSVKSFPPV